MLVDLLGLTVLAEKPPEHTHAPDPDDLLGHTGVTGTPPLTDTHVPTLALGQEILPYASARVHHGGLSDDVAILDELTDSLACGSKSMSTSESIGIETVMDALGGQLTRVRHRDLADLIRVEPDLLLATFHHAGREALLKLEGHHPESICPPHESVLPTGMAMLEGLGNRKD